VEIDIPNDIKTFIDEVVDSFVMWDFLIFWSKKSGEMETPAQIAKLLGHGTEEVRKPMEKLVKIGLFSIQKRLDGEQACSLNPKSELYPGLQRFWGFNESQENRLRILSYLLQKRIR
jgi:hypothetical protein